MYSVNHEVCAMQIIAQHVCKSLFVCAGLSGLVLVAG